MLAWNAIAEVINCSNSCIGSLFCRNVWLFLSICRNTTACYMEWLFQLLMFSELSKLLKNSTSPGCIMILTKSKNSVAYKKDLQILPVQCNYIELISFMGWEKSVTSLHFYYPAALAEFFYDGCFAVWVRVVWNKFGSAFPVWHKYQMSLHYFCCSANISCR